MPPHHAPHHWVKPTAEYAPLLGFFFSYWLYGLNIATAVLVVLTLLATLMSRLLIGKTPFIPLMAAALVVLFGGLTLLLDDERFIKMKPTIVQAIMGAALLISARWQKPLLQSMLGQALQMERQQWQTLSFRYALFFFAMAGLNEYVWRLYSTDVWVNFKFFGLTGLTFVFSMTQVMYIMRYSQSEEQTSSHFHDHHPDSERDGKRDGKSGGQD